MPTKRMDSLKEETPSYFAVIPADIRYDDRLSPSEKLLFGEITALSRFNGYCWAGNKYFSKLYGKRIETISRWIKNLSKFNYIKIYYKRGNHKLCVTSPKDVTARRGIIPTAATKNRVDIKI